MDLYPPSERKCKRCGACCHYFLDGKMRKCKFLIRISDRITACRIYDHRLGQIIDISQKDLGVFVRCVNRSEDQRLFLGCPLNRSANCFKN